MNLVVNKTMLLFPFLFLISLTGCSRFQIQASHPEAVNGVMDLTQWDLNHEKPLELRGQWEFYWKNFYSNEDFYDGRKIEKTGYFNLPGAWNGYEVGGEKLPGEGYATYRLHLILNPEIESIAFKVLSIQTSSTIFLNGDLIASAGTAGVNAQTSIPGFKPRIFVYKPDRDYIDIVIHVSNFHHRMGGLWQPILVGSEKSTNTLWRYHRDRDFFLLGAIFIMGLYHLGLYYIRRGKKEALYFSMFCFIIALRTLVTDDIFILDIVPDFPWNLLISLEYMTFFASIPLFLLFIHSLFKDNFLSLFIKVVIIIALIFSSMTFLLPLRVCSRLIPVFQFMTIFSGLYTLMILIRHSLKKDFQAILILAGFVILFLTAINDILYTANIISSFYLISYGILVFIFFQAVVMTLRFASLFSEVDRQRRQLLKTNKEYLREIDERSRLESDLRISYLNNAKSRLAIIVGLAKLAEYRDSDTGSHIERIQEYSSLLARLLQKHPKYSDYISDEYIQDLYASSVLHDIGKVGISDYILQKPGRLTPEEFEKMKEHPIIGGDSIKVVEMKTGIRSFLTLGREIAYMHHERWDGTGYPYQAKGEDIPLSARLVALVDVYDALTSKRCYKEAFTHEESLKIIMEGRGTHFDPDLVDAFQAAHEEFDRIRQSLHDDSIF